MRLYYLGFRALAQLMAEPRAAHVERAARLRITTTTPAPECRRGKCHGVVPEQDDRPCGIRLSARGYHVARSSDHEQIDRAGRYGRRLGAVTDAWRHGTAGDL